MLGSKTVSRQRVILAALVMAASGCGKKQDHGDPGDRSIESSIISPASAAVVRPAAPRTVEPEAPKPVAPERSEHAVFQLVDNRHAAHRYTGGDLVLDGADA